MGTAEASLVMTKLCDEEEAWTCGRCPEGPEGYGHC
jgi:hypothetical protein